MDRNEKAAPGVEAQGGLVQHHLEHPNSTVGPAQDAKPVPNRDLILEALDVLIHPDHVTELRALRVRGRKRIDAGYFDRSNHEALADAAVWLNGKADAAVYIALNPVDPQLLGRYLNRIEQYALATTTDRDIVRRRWLPLDFDPVRPKDTSATNEQKAYAYAVLEDARRYLSGEGWPSPVMVDSGNGYHLHYPIDLPNTDAVTAAVKAAINAIADRFDTARVKIDRSMFNASRIIKLPGTVANKGDHTGATPWRRSILLEAPSRCATVTIEQLRALAPAASAQPGPESLTAPPGSESNPADGVFARVLSRLGGYTQDLHQGADRYRLDRCPFNPEHRGGAAAVFRWPSGKLGFKCQHNSCADKHWADLRKLIDPRPPHGEPRDQGHSNDGRAAAGEPDGWPVPKPILAELAPVPAFDAEALLPDILRDWIMDEAERMPCSPEFIAGAALVALGSIVGARCAIKPKSRDSWLVVPNLWGGIVGDPSAKKSPAWGAALRPMDRLIKTANEQHSAALGEYQTQQMVFKANLDAIEGRLKEAARKPGKEDAETIAKQWRKHGATAPSPPTLKRYKTNDCTVEKLGELLRDNPEGVLVLRDELVGLIAVWEREGREGERAFFLEAWNGNQSFDTDRIGRGHISIPNICVSIFGGIQPDKLTAYLKEATHALANDGMLQRFQVLLFPDHRRWEWRDRGPNKRAREAAFDVFKALASLDPVQRGAAPADDYCKFPHFRFHQEAQDLFIKWSEDLHLDRIPREEEPIVQQHLAKFDKLFPALALIFHLVDCVANGVAGPVSQEAARYAQAWCAFLEAHARRCYGLLKDDGLVATQALAAKLGRGLLKESFTLRDVRRYQWRHLTDDAEIRAALDWLEDEGWLRGEEVGGTGPGAGRKTTRYSINPSIPRSGRDSPSPAGPAAVHTRTANTAERNPTGNPTAVMAVLGERVSQKSEEEHAPPDGVSPTSPGAREEIEL